MKKKVIGSLVVVILVVSVVGYYEYTGYESVVVSTSVVMGKITNDQASGAGLPGGGAGGIGGIVGGIGGGAPAPKPATTTTTRTSTTSRSTASTASGLSFITITVGTDSFTQILSCGTNAYYAGMSVQVADQLLRSGGHQYAADVACKGQVSAFKVLYPQGYTATTSTSTSTTTT